MLLAIDGPVAPLSSSTDTYASVRPFCNEQLPEIQPWTALRTVAAVCSVRNERDCNSKLAEQPAEWHSRSKTMPKNGTLRKKKRLKARRGMDRATGVADEGSNGTRPPRTARWRAGRPSRTRRRSHAARRGRSARRTTTTRASGCARSGASGSARSAAARRRRHPAPSRPRPRPRPCRTSWRPRGPATRLQKGTLGGGIVIEDTALGEGREARHASSVDVAYEAFVLREDGGVRGTAIDRATARDPYGFVVGSGDVIRGLSEGVKGMRPGGRRVITVPWQYAYGAKGRPPKVPPKSRLRFDVQLLEVGAGFVS